MNPPVGPLAGVRIVVTRPRAQAQRLIEALIDEGAVVVSMPTIAITRPTTWGPLDESLKRLCDGEYDVVVFASANAARSTLRRMERVSSGEISPQTKIAVVGRKTGEVASEFGVAVDVVPPEYTSDSLIAALGEGGGRRLLLPRVEDGPRALVDSLASRGWKVDEVAAYRNKIPDEARVPEKVRRGEFDAVTFASPSAAGNFVALVGDLETLSLAPDQPPGPAVACIGPETAQGAQASGLRIDIVAAQHTSDGLVAALKEHFTRRHR